MSRESLHTLMIAGRLPTAQERRGLPQVSEGAALTALWGPELTAGGGDGGSDRGPTGDPAFNAFTRLGRRMAAAQVGFLDHSPQARRCFIGHSVTGS